MTDDRDLVSGAIESGFFGEAPLADAPPAPEKYTIERCLGRGGGGAVFLAREVALGRPVAIKFLHETTAAQTERFLREARFAARLNSPAIVQIYEAGEHEGQPYIAMQFIEGGNLASVPLDVNETLAVAREVASALLHAHRSGIVHRDIKPENILVDAQKRPFLTDFGIARDLRGELGATISQEGQIMGTPALMPPEQARGDIHAVDERSDIYALGATLFYTLCRRWPFQGDNVVDMLHAVLHDDPPFPRAFNPAIPRPVETIILRCMKKRREDRYASMQEVIDALDAAGSATAAPVASAWFRTLVKEQVGEVPEPASPKPETEEDLRASLAVAREIAAWDTHLYRVRSNLPRHYRKLDAVIERLDRVLRERPSCGWARFYRGLARFRQGELAAAAEDMERSIDRVRDPAGAYFELGRLYLATYLAQQRQARRHMTDGGRDHHLGTARSFLDQASVAFEEARRLQSDLPGWQLRFTEAVRLVATGDLDAALELCDAILEEDPDLEEVWKLRGDVLRWSGGDPHESYARAHDVRQSYYEAPLAGAEAFLAEGETERARACLETVIEIRPDLARVRGLLARTYVADDPARAVEVAAEAPDDYEARLVAAEARTALGRHEEALADLTHAARLDGCQNRVAYLHASTILDRARRTSDEGGDASADIEQVLAFGRSEPVRLGDGPHWRELMKRAEALRRV